ncbi:CaiB/BaiF CoA-transferase family protein [Pseudofrankia inefficax]|uniref:CaiB/BaiF CoA-transferase family protein n=1 Tax=Pseudofrankia inefficax (strain DSM 45817 / CECT 9037 / DDB 130130 / EuI1c) TaxID=298654 RepID=UPI0012FDC3C5|nr:CoA transferase [Pseudofrankia inefficax]
MDLSVDVAGGFAARLMGGSGLRVVRPRGGGPPVPTGDDLLRVYLDAGKEHLPCPASPSGLVDAEDLVFLTFDRGAYIGLPAGWTVEDLPAGCVRVTTSSFGTTGPYRTWRGGPLADWAAGGYLGITGDPDRPPLIGPEHLCGYVAGYTAAIAAEAALRHRARTGEPQRVDLSTMESMLSVHQSTFSRLAVGIVRERTGRYTEVYPLVVRPCLDGYVSLGVVTDAEFDRLAIAVGRAELAADERFADAAARWAHRDALDTELDTFLGARTAEQAVAVLVEHGVAAAKVVGPYEVLRNPQLAHRGFWRQPAGRGGSGRMPGDPVPAGVTLGSSPRSDRRRAGRARHRGALPLSGLTVLDFTAFWAGPLATRWLADLGADVVWVERPGSRAEPGGTTQDLTAEVMRVFHRKMNRNKRSVLLDLKTAAGRAAARRLAAEADLLVENFRPGVMAAFGLGPAEMCALNPELVYVSLSGFGASGPWAARRSYGPTIEAASSVEGRTGYPGGEPLRLGHTLPDATGGLAGALAALRGLRDRDASGRGGWFDVSQLEVYAALCGEEILAASLTGQDPPRIGNRSRHGGVQGVFRCAGDDAWIAVRLAGRRDLERLAEVTGLDGLARAARTGPRDDAAAEALIAGYTATRDKHRTAALLQDAGLEAFAVLGPAELLADDHLRARGFFVTARPGDTLPGSPLHSEPPLVDPRGPAPRFGAHTDEVLGQFGLPRPEIAHP